MATKGSTLKPGMVIGDLTLRMRVRPSKSGSYVTRKKWRCDCSCGAAVTVPEQYLVRTKPKDHCGAALHTSTFISTHKAERGIWLMMRVRCYDSRHVGYIHYGARGIKVCDRWLNDPEGFENFVKDMGRRPSMNHTLDRVDPDGWYQPFQADGVTKQCRWATWDEQNNNKRYHKYARQEQEAQRQAALGIPPASSVPSNSPTAVASDESPEEADSNVPTFSNKP